MRWNIAVLGAIAFAVLGAFAAVRLDGALRQLRALDAAVTSRALPAAASAGRAADAGASASAAASDAGASSDGGAASDDGGASDSGTASDGAASVLDTGSTRRAALAWSGSEHVQQWLLSDPDFQRGAEELERDSDPAAALEARRLLEELGAEVPQPDGDER